MADTNTAGTQAAPGAAASGASAGTQAAGQAAAAGAQQQVPITALHEEREKRQALADEVAALKQQLQTIASNQHQANDHRAAAPAQQAGAEQAQLDALWRTDPRAAMRFELGGALDWADRVNQAVEEQADVLAGRKEYADFGNYRAEIMRHVRKLPLTQRGQAGVIETAYFLVKGRQSDTVASQRAAEAVTKFKSGEAAGGGAAAGGNAGGTTQQQTGLSDQEKAVAAAMGVSEEEYTKYRKR